MPNLEGKKGTKQWSDCNTKAMVETAAHELVGKKLFGLKIGRFFFKTWKAFAFQIWRAKCQTWKAKRAPSSGLIATKRPWLKPQRMN